MFPCASVAFISSNKITQGLLIYCLKVKKRKQEHAIQKMKKCVIYARDYRGHDNYGQIFEKPDSMFQLRLMIYMYTMC